MSRTSIETVKGLEEDEASSSLQGGGDRSGRLPPTIKTATTPSSSSLTSMMSKEKQQYVDGADTDNDRNSMFQQKKYQQQQQQEQEQRDPIHLWSSLVAGVGSAAIASVACAPFDVLRTRIQVWGQLNPRSTVAAASSSATSIPRMARDILVKEGWRGFFRGLGMTLITVPCFWGVYFPLYDDMKRSWARHSPETHPAWIHMGSAVTAGAVSDLICNPLFVVRTRLQTEVLHQWAATAPVATATNAATSSVTTTTAPQQQRQFSALQSPQLRPSSKSIVETFQSLYAEGGLLIFWRGMMANLIGLSHVAVQFPVYEQLKQRFKHHKPHESAWDLLLASGLSKMTASLLTYPHEVIRSRMMDTRLVTMADGTKSTLTLMSTCRLIYAQEGMAGFYAGLPVTLLRVMPNTCITFITYELFLRWARTRIDEYRQQQEQQQRQANIIR